MNLDSATKQLEIVLGEAMATAECDWVSAFAMADAGNFLLGASDGTTNGTTAVVVVAAPPGGQWRQVKEVRLHNADTVQHQVTLQLNNGGTIRVIETASVAPGGDFLYTPDAPAVVSTGAPAILLEGGTSGAKISAMPAAAALNGAETFPVVQGGVNDKATGNQLGLLILNGAFSANPLDAAFGSGLAGTGLNLNGGNGDGAGNGGDITVLTGLAGASGTATGNLSVQSLPATIANQSSGFAGIFSGDVTAGSGASGDAFIGTGEALSGASGVTTIYTGNSASGTSGTTNVGTGNGISSGSLALSTGTATGAGNHSGTISLRPGAAAAGATKGIVAIAGTTTNDSASAGDVGEYLETNTAGTSLVTGTAKDVATRSLTAGDWDVWGSVVFHPAAGTTVSRIAGSIGTTANTLGTAPNSGAMFDESVALTAATDQTRPVGMRRLSLSGTTTVSLTALAAFAVSTMTADGFIGARRRR